MNAKNLVLASEKTVKTFADVSLLARAKARQDKTFSQRKQERRAKDSNFLALEFMNDITKDIAWHGAATPEYVLMLLS